ncbi:hypothetical protein L1987_83937 [Smallanthus sonchifolius]|nr:hypothetical protein L1987_83937 [Smallanthus sonchifolius]
MVVADEALLSSVTRFWGFDSTSELFPTTSCTEAILGFVEKNFEIKDYGEFALEKGISQEGIVNVIKSFNGLRFVNG